MERRTVENADPTDAETDPTVEDAEASAETDPTSVTHIGVASSFYGCTINTPSDALSPPGDIKKRSREEEGEKKRSRRVPLIPISSLPLSISSLPLSTWRKGITTDDVLDKVDPSKLKYLKKRMEE